jgi:hypothetical protein
MNELRWSDVNAFVATDGACPVNAGHYLPASCEFGTTAASATNKGLKSADFGYPGWRRGLEEDENGQVE